MKEKTIARLILLIIALGFYAVLSWRSIENRKLDLQQNMDRANIIHQNCLKGGYFKDGGMFCNPVDSIGGE